jgi:hypothetical protein
LSAVAVAPQELAVSRVRALHVVVAVYAVSALYHALNSFWHVTPAVFTDELLYSKLAQSLADGNGLSIRGEFVFFPGLLPVLAQAPLWLIPDTQVAYGAIKVVNALLMSSAVFPAYWLARQVVQPRRAALAAVLVGVSPALIYHDYLMSEALAFPVFLAAAATMMRALERSSRRWELAVVGMSLVAVTTRVQFVVLPVAYVAAACAASGGVRAALRRHRISVGAFGAAGVLGAATGGVVLGPYVGAAFLDYNVPDLVRWGGYSALLVPFGWAWFLTPGAALGWVGLRRTPFGVFTAVVVALTIVEITLVAGGQAERPLERYAIYLAPLAFICFLAYCEGPQRRRRVYAALAAALGLGVWLVPFPTLAPPIRGFNFSFDSPTLSSYGALVMQYGHPNAATIVCGVSFLGCAAAALAAWRGVTAEILVAPAVAALALASVAAYAGDRAMTESTHATYSPTGADWIDRTGAAGPVDYLVLPGSSPHFAFAAEAWNRSFGRPLLLDAAAGDSFASDRAQVAPDGGLLVGGRPTAARTLAINGFASRVDVEGTPVGAPRRGLGVYRLRAGAHVRSLATGLYFDDWAAGDVRFRAWPATAGGGRYDVRLQLPRGFRARTVTLTAGAATRRVVLAPGRSADVSLPVSGRPLPELHIRATRADSIGAYSQNARVVALRVPRLRYVASTQARP